METKNVGVKMEESWIPVRSKCTHCDMMVESGMFNWIKHYEDYHTEHITFKTEFTEEELKRLLIELLNERDTS